MLRVLLFSILERLKYNYMPGKAQQIHRQFEKMEIKKNNLLALLHTLPVEKYTRQPSPESWSIAQAANHIYLSERLSLAYLRKKMSYPDTIPTYHIRSWGAVMLIKFTLWTGYKVKAPKAINMWEQQDILSPEELDKKWSKVRSDLISFMEEHLPAFGSHLVYNHPFAGRMTMYQTMIFFNEHMSHHLRQIDRILAKVK
jgi:hypothetical protein